MRIPITILLLSAAAFAAEPEKPAAKDEKPPCCRAALDLGKPTDQSLYQLETKWTSDVGKEVKLGVLRGRVQVVAMFFTHCESACPILVEDLRRLERALPAALRDRVDFLLVSFDSERDTPAVLRAFREKRALPMEHWTLLRGREDDVRELAALLGIHYRRDARGQFAHSNVIHVLNAEGEVAAQQSGLNGDGKILLAAIERLLAPKKP